MKTNLKTLSDTLATMEGGKHDLGSPQVAEVLGKLGEYLRGLCAREAMQTVTCIVERAGRKSKT